MSCDDISVNVLLRSLVVRLSGLLSVFTTGWGQQRVFHLCASAQLLGGIFLCECTIKHVILGNVFTGDIFINCLYVYAIAPFLILSIVIIMWF